MKNVAWAGILELDVDERIDLVEVIWDSIAAVPERIPLADWQREELDRRLQRYHQDADAGSPWDEVRQRIVSSASVKKEEEASFDKAERDVVASSASRSESRLKPQAEGGSMSKVNWWVTACGVCMLGAAAAIASPAQTFTTLHRFDLTDGDNPYAGLAQAANGDLYGTTFLGGANGGGDVFKISPTGTLTVPYNFRSPTDGAFPRSGLIPSTEGSFYGTTSSGGANGYGTIFRINSTGIATTLYSFCRDSGCTDGRTPRAGLVQVANGDFYGTTYEGGAENGGTVFAITRDGALTTLYGFCSQSGCTDGQYPEATLVEAIDGGLYGTTLSGGANNSGLCEEFSNTGCGTVFKITPSGTLTTLYSFCSQIGCADGGNPEAALVQTADGNLYGTTQFGGANGDGTVFKITPSGTLTTLYSFCSQIDCSDGAVPTAGLTNATDGNFYGTTAYGGAKGFYGTVFKITPTGALTTLYSFCLQVGCTDGESPVAPLVQDTDGNFYGTTLLGGADARVCSSGCGTVFALDVGLGPFVEARPTSGTIGAAVKILGTDLTGATSVSFNGAAATFTVNASGSPITTTVPTGATTGFVTVTTPSGTLKSNVQFRVP